MTTESLLWAIIIVGGYLIGSIHFCRLIGLIFYRKDICKISKDGNPGTANAFWYLSKPAGIFGLFLDLAKGFLPVFLALTFLDSHSPLFVLVMLAPVCGHAWSIFYYFRGGKCIATIFGELAALFFTWATPILLLILGFADLFFSFVVKILPGNKRALIIFSILILASIPVCVLSKQYEVMVGTILISAVAIVKHLPIYTPEEKVLKGTKQ